jgi:hypothetical protein
MIGKFMAVIVAAGAALVITTASDSSAHHPVGAAMHQSAVPESATEPMAVNRTNKGDRLPLFRPAVPAGHFGTTVTV